MGNIGGNLNDVSSAKLDRRAALHRTTQRLPVLQGFRVEHRAAKDERRISFDDNEEIRYFRMHLRLTIFVTRNKDSFANLVRVQRLARQALRPVLLIP